MGNRRKDRVSELLKEEIADILIREVKDPRIVLVTIMDVDVTKDLRQAKVFFSVNKSSKEEALRGLNSASKFIKRTLGKRVRLKYIPTIIFIYDNSLEYGSKIDKIIEDLKGEDSL